MKDDKNMNFGRGGEEGVGEHLNSAIEPINQSRIDQ